jgi:protein-disulfide isomerase/uncharacterized membrane protein
MNKKNTTKKKNEATQKGYKDKLSGWFVIITAMAGLSICLYLYSFHFNLLIGEIKSGVLCGAENGLNCHSVVSSPYSIILGLPLAVWGAIFYSAIVLLGFGGIIFWRDCGQAFFRWAFFLAILGLVFDLNLAHTMIFRIRAVCWICISTYLINIAITIILAKEIWREPKPRVSLLAIFPGQRDAQGMNLYYRNVIKGFLIGGILLASVVWFTGSGYLSKSLTENDRERLVKIRENLLQQKSQFIEVNNRPLKGSGDAKLTVVEFSDFLCPYCAKAATYLDLSTLGSHDKARFIFRHYPLDQSCNKRISSNVHPGACSLAEGAVCAYEQDKFWEYHDIAFETKGRISRSVILNIASNIGLDLNVFKSCLDSNRGLVIVKEDIEAGFNAGVKGTPTLFINGRILMGVPKPWVLNEIFQFGKENLSTPGKS